MAVYSLFYDRKLFKRGRGSFIINWFRHLPPISMDWSDWTPFIQNDWYRKHYMKFVYLLQIIIFLIPFFFETSFTHITIFYLTLMGIFVFVIHECLHIIVINKKGDSLTVSRTFFLLSTNAILSKTRFWLFMSLPIIVLSVVPAVLSFYVLGNLKAILLFVCWINAVMSSSDIYNSFLIASKPKKTVFCRGYYLVNKS